MTRVLQRCQKHILASQSCFFRSTATMAATQPSSSGSGSSIYNVYPFKPASKKNNKNSATTTTTTSDTVASNATATVTGLTSSSTQSRRSVTLPPLPELYQPFEQYLDSLSSLKPTPLRSGQTKATTHPFLSALTDFSNKTETWNGAAAYKSTLSPVLDAFVALSQNTQWDSIKDLLDKSWQADPDGTLRVIWNLRSIHQGKAAKSTFYRAFAWLYTSHPMTAIANLQNLVTPVIRYTIKPKARRDPIAAGEDEDDMEIITHEDAKDDAVVENAKKKSEDEIELGRSHGYWKDLLNILLLATTDQCHPTSNFSSLSRAFVRSKRPTRRVYRDSASAPDPAPAPTPTPTPVVDPTQIKKQASELRGKNYIEWHRRLMDKLQNDRVYRVLYVRIAQLFADALSRDIEILKKIADPNTSTERRLSMAFDLTLVGKWAPTPGASHDRMTNIATAIAELLHSRGQLNVRVTGADIPSNKNNQPLNQEDAHRLLVAYTQSVTSPLRRFLQIPEVAMSAQQWDKIKYHRVPSKCMQINKVLFFKRDEERFSRYLYDVARGKKKISGATLLPHELLKEAMEIHCKYPNPHEAKLKGMLSQVVDEQWKSMVNRVREAGTLENCMAVCDVSGSMGSVTYPTEGTVRPIFPAVALSILLSEIAQPPWAGKFITFSSKPEMVTLDPTTGLSERALKMNGSSWLMNTDFNAVFTKLILPAAVEAKLKPEDMVKRLFVFSDMQFDNSRTDNNWETEHQIIKRKFEEAGYELPEIVYWNLQGDVAQPATKDEPGVAMLSGFSPNMLKAFMEEGQAENKGEDEDGATATVEAGTEMTVDNAKKKKTEDNKHKFTPEENMLKILGDESYSELKVVENSLYLY